MAKKTKCKCEACVSFEGCEAARTARFLEWKLKELKRLLAAQGA